MKKWMIGLAAAGGVFCLAGVGMIAAGVMMYGTGERPAPPWLAEIEDEFSDGQRDLRSGPEEIPDVPDEAAEISDGNPAGTEEPENRGNLETDNAEKSLKNDRMYENVRSLELETAGDQVHVVESADLKAGQIQVSEIGEGIDYRIYQEESELKIRLPLSANRNAAGDVGMKQLTVAIPPSYEFEQIELEHVAGSFYAERLFARELSVEVVSGTMDIGGGRVKELELECISGSCRCMAAAEYSVSAENISGDTTICLSGTENDFDYEIEAGGGSIYVNGQEQRVFQNSWKENQWNHHTGREAELSCTSGTITVEFEEQV